MLFDTTIFNFIFGLARKSKLLDSLGIFLAKYLPYILVILAIVLILKEKNWKNQVYIFSLMALSVILSRGIITEIIKFFWHRERPFVAMNFQPLATPWTNWSFPSAHAVAFFALAFAIFLISKHLGVWFIVGACLIGLARIFIGVHWPTDILGGILVAFISVLIVKKLLPGVS
ncbi:MAG: phosphatase PAP2 family protein [Candidatus Paceibacterota bacterium]|jgi:undecaprenyl-diphosphatase